MVSDPDRLHVVADRHHHAGALVTEDDRRDLLRPDRLHRQIAVADADRADRDEDLVAAGLVQLDLGDFER